MRRLKHSATVGGTPPRRLEGSGGRPMARDPSIRPIRPIRPISRTGMSPGRGLGSTATLPSGEEGCPEMADAETNLDNALPAGRKAPRVSVPPPVPEAASRRSSGGLSRGCIIALVIGGLLIVVVPGILAVALTNWLSSGAPEWPEPADVRLEPSRPTGAPRADRHGGHRPRRHRRQPSLLPHRRPPDLPRGAAGDDQPGPRRRNAASTRRE